MSRTDKDRPYWVRIHDPLVQTQEIHRHISLIERKEVACTIDEVCPPYHKEPYRFSCRRVTLFWRKEESEYGRFYYPTQRSSWRDELVRARKHYNANDEDFDNEVFFVSSGKKCSRDDAD